MRTHTLMYTPHTHTRTGTGTHSHKLNPQHTFIRMYKSTHTQTRNNFYKYVLAFLSLGALFQCTFRTNLLYDCLPKSVIERLQVLRIVHYKERKYIKWIQMCSKEYTAPSCLCETLHVGVFYTPSKKQL